MNTAVKASAAIAKLPQSNVARSEATKVEQSRAVAEVKAMVIVAQQVPRNEGMCRLAMQASCAQPGLAERAFFRYSRGGTAVTGPSIHLAVDLARCWGNVKYGLKEMSRDDEAGQSEMMAYAWDLQTNSQSETTFIVPHMRDKKDGPVPLTDMRDIYENNANMGARRLREMIFRVLPPWFTEEAKDVCNKTLVSDADVSPAEKKKAMLEAYAQLGISVARLEARVGSKVSLWTPVDMAQLKVIYGSIARREISADEEFPTVTSEAAAAAIASTPKPDAAATPTTESAATPPADASGEAPAASQPATPAPEAPTLPIDTPPQPKRPPLDVSLFEEAFVNQLRRFKDRKGIDQYVKVTHAENLAQLREQDPEAWQRVMDAVDLRKEQVK